LYFTIEITVYPDPLDPLVNLILWVYILLYFTIDIAVYPDPLNPLVNLILWVYILLYFTIRITQLFILIPSIQQYTMFI
jgi:hypothetical protein